MGRLKRNEYNEVNPFLEQALSVIENNLVKKYRNSMGNTTRAVSKLVDQDTGEILVTSFMKQIKVDEAQFTKIYTNGLKAFFDLSNPSIRVLGYIMTVLKPSKDFIIFKLDDCMKYTGYKSVMTIYKGLNGLIDAGIIARGPVENTWYINPMILFNGNRITFAQQYICDDPKYDPREGIAPPQLENLNN